MLQSPFNNICYTMFLNQAECYQVKVIYLMHNSDYCNFDLQKL